MSKSEAKPAQSKTPAPTSKSADNQNNGSANGAKAATVNGAAKPTAANQAPAKSAPPTIAHTLGEMVWLMTRSLIHKHLKIADLEWHLMPAILLNQFRLFRAGEQVVGLALWAYITPEQAEEMGKEGRLKPEQWRHGTDVMEVIKAQQSGEAKPLAEPELKEGEVELWLVDFIVPFATAENKLAQVCMADLVQGPLKGKKLKMHKTDPKTGEKSVIELGE